MGFGEGFLRDFFGILAVAKDAVGDPNRQAGRFA